MTGKRELKRRTAMLVVKKCKEIKVETVTGKKGKTNRKEVW